MIFKTVGTIKRLDTAKGSLAIDPISAYAMESVDGDKSSEKIVMKEIEKGLRLFLLPLDSQFEFEKSLLPILTQFKLNRQKIEIRVETAIKTFFEKTDFGDATNKFLPVELISPLVEDCESVGQAVAADVKVSIVAI